MKKRMYGKRAAAWILSAVMVFSNSSFAVLAEEQGTESAPVTEAQMASEPEAAAEEAPVAEESPVVEEAPAVEEIPAVEEAPEVEDTSGENSSAAEEAGGDVSEPEEGEASEPLTGEAEGTTERVPEAGASGTEEELFDEEEQIIGDTYEDEEVESAELLPMAQGSGEGEEDQGLFVDLEWKDYGSHNSNGDMFTWIYEGAENTLLLNKDGLGDLTDYTVEWSVVDLDMETGEETANPSTVVEVVSSDNDQIILRANEGCGNTRVGVFAFVKDGEGQQVAGAGMDVFTTPTVEDYYYPAQEPGENMMLVGNVIGLGSTVNYYVEDADHPYGEEGEIPISDVIVTGQYSSDEDGQEVPAEGIVRTESDGENWMICGDEYGRAEVSIVHQAYGSEETVEYPFEVYVNGDYWELRMDYPDNSDTMLTGGSMNISTSLYHEWRYGDDQGSEMVENYTLQLDPNFTSDALTVSVDGTNLTVTSTGGETIERISVSAVVPDLDEVCTRYFNVSVSEGYYLITPSYADGNVPIKGELDLNQAGLQVWQYAAGEEPTLVESVEGRPVEFRVTGYDGNAWSVKEGTEEDLIPVFIRQGEWDTDVTVEAGYSDGEGNWNGLTSRNYHYNGLDYSVWFEEGVEEPENNHTWVFKGNTRDLALNTENLQDKGDVSIQWTVYQGFDDTLEDGGDYYGEIPDGLTVSEENPGRATLDGSALWEGAKKDENGNANDVVVVARVMSGEGENAIELYRTDVWVGVWEAEQEYRWTKPANMLIDDTIWVGAYDTGCWVRNPEHPDGEDMGVTIKDIQILESWQWDDEAQGDVRTDKTIISIENFVDEEDPDNYGWNLHGEDFGWVKLAITYELDGQQYTDENTEIHVSGDDWYVDWSYPEGTDQLLPGDTMTIDNFILRHDYVDNEGNHIYGEEEAYDSLSLMWDADEDGNTNPTYDTNMVSAVVTEDGKGIRITANSEENYGGTNIYVRVMVQETDEEGNLVTDGDGNAVLNEMSGADVNINVTDGYWNLTPADLENVPVGETLDLSAIDWQVTWNYVDGDGNPVSEPRDPQENGFRLLVENYDGIWEPVEGQEGELLPTLTRISGDSGNIRVIAQFAQRDENGEPLKDEETGALLWEDGWFTQRELFFDGLDYSVWFEEGVEEPENNHTWVFTGDSRELALNTENLQDKGDVSIQWTVYQGFDDTLEDGGDYYGEIPDGLTVSEEDPGRATLNGTALAAGAETNENGGINDVVVVARVMSGEGENAIELYRTDVWVGVWEAEQEYRWTKQDNILIDDTIWVGAYDTGCFVRNPEHPDGEDVGVTITDIQILESWQWDDEAQDDVLTDNTIISIEKDEENNGWNLAGKDFGWVKLAIIYELDGQQYTDENTEIHVSGDNWYVDWSYPEGTNQMRPGDTMTIDNFILRHDYVDNEGNHIYGEEEAYDSLSLLWDADEDGNTNPTYDTNMVSAEVTEDGKGIRITANSEENYGGTNIYVRVMVQETDEDGNAVLNEMSGADVNINVTDGYWNLTPADLENVPMGGTLDLSAVEWNLTRHYRNEDGSQGEETVDLSDENSGYRLRMEGFDENAWALAEGQENELLPVLTRISNEGGGIQVVAEEAQRNEEGELLRDETGEILWAEGWLTNRDLWFDGLDYNVWFEEGVEEPENNHTWVFTGDSRELALNTENLQDKGDVSIQWTVYQGFDDTLEDGGDYYGEITKGLTVSEEDPGRVTLDGSALAAGAETNENGGINDVVVVARVMSGEGENAIELSRTDVWVGIYQKEQRYDWTKERNVLMGNSIWVGADETSCFVRNAEHPDGEDVGVTITDIQVKENWYYDDEAQEKRPADYEIVRVESVEDGDNYGWNLNAVECGWANLAVTYELDGETYTDESVEISVQGDIWYLEWEYPEGTDTVRPGDTMTIENFILKRDYKTENGEYVYGEEMDYETLSVYWDADENGNANPTFDPEWVDVEVTESGKGLKITAGQNCGGLDIQIRVLRQSLGEDGEPLVDESGNHVLYDQDSNTWLHINIGAAYYSLTPVTLDNVPMGGTLDLASAGWNLVLKETDEDGNLQERTIDLDTEEGYRVLLADYDQNAWAVADGQEDELLPTLTRLTGDENRIQVFAQEAQRDERTGEFLRDENNDLIWDNETGWIAQLELKFEETDEHIHKLTHHEAVAATCTAGGNVEYWSCEICDLNFSNAEGTEEIADGVETPATGHNMTHHDKVEATCTEAGTVEYWSCNACGLNFSDEAGSKEITDVEIAASHTLTYHETVESTCIKEGNIAYYSCDVCGLNFSDAEGTEEITGSVAVAKASHTLTHHEAVASTCTTGGNVEYWSCSVCEKNFRDAEGTEEITDGVETPATGHTMTHHEAKEATCTEEGNVEYWSCDGCGKNFSDEAGTTELTDVKIAASHTLTHYEAVAATCTAGGNVEYWSCTVCGKNFSDEAGTTEITGSVETPAMGHSLTHHEAVAATCTKEGNIEYYSCDRCGKNFSDAEGTEEITGSVAVAKVSHTLTHHEKVAATCTAAGTKEYWSCSVCGKNFSDAAGTQELASVTESPTGHRMTAHQAAVAATCTTAGNIEYWTCGICGKKFSNAQGTTEVTNVTTAALGHSMTYHAAVTATCSRAGNVAYYSCGRCGKNFSNAQGTAQITGSVTTAMLAHQWTAWTTVSKATVFAPEKQTRTCKVTNHSETRDYGSKLKPTMKLTANSLVMKVKQSTTKFTVSGMAEGDSLASVTSSNTALLKVTSVNKKGTFKLTAQKKTGTVNLTFKLASGLTKTIKVKIQKSNVKSTGISGVAKTLTVQQGKTVKLSPVIAPVTSHDKVKYSTSNKKVATVSSKGVVKGVKGGTAKITIKAGKKKFVCTVKVQGVKTTKLTNVKSAITLKKKKSYTLKPKRVPAASSDAIKYSSSNKKVATVSSKGKITAKAAGTAVITVKCGSAVATCTVTVK